MPDQETPRKEKIESFVMGKEMNYVDQSKRQKFHWLDIVKAIFDFIVIAVMVWALIVAFNANETSRAANKIALEAWRNSYVPWLSVRGLEPSPMEDPNSFKMVMHCKNFSDAPALNFNIEFKFDGIKVLRQTLLYDTAAFMPNDERKIETTVTVTDGRAKERVEKLKTGKYAIEVKIQYEDIFRRKFTVRHGFKYIDSVCCPTNYVIEGIDALFEEIE